MRTFYTVFFIATLGLTGLLPNMVWSQEDTDSHKGIRIAWDYSSMHQLAERGGYPRLTRLQDSTLLLIYETRTGDIHLKQSTDHGMTWTAPITVFSRFVYSNLEGKSTIVHTANPEIKQLQNGDIVIACNYRPQQAEIAPYTIVVRRSVDNGKTWLSPQNLYTAAPRFGDGCWEPAFLQLPNGELQVYFANENPYQHSDEQEISMLRSADNGVTWSDTPTTVSFRKDRRDGMPVPQIIDQEIVVAIEDNKIDQFKPYTVRTSLQENWANPILSDSPERDYALLDPIKDSVYMGAPYFIKLPNGQTLISYQTNENRAHDWELSTMEVAVGDCAAKNFGQRSRPFDVPLDKEAKWNALALWDDQTVVALSSSNFRSTEVAPWLIKGHIIPSSISATRQKAEYPIFIGAKGKTNVKAGIQVDDKNLYLNCILSQVPDRSVSERNWIYTFLYVDGSLLKIICDDTGQKSLWVYEKEKWEPSNLVDKIDVEIHRSPQDQSTNLHFRIPKTIRENKAWTSLKLGLALSAYDVSKGRYTERLADMDEENPNTWLNIKL